jgi:hypothetical protein
VAAVVPTPRGRAPWTSAHPPVAHESALEPLEHDTEDALIRPFLVTGGRTRPLQDGLRVETLISTRPAALSAPVRFEQRAIVQLCQYPHSVAEIAVALGVPLGVAKVLIADLLTSGLAQWEEPDEISIAMLERIRDRVRTL